MVVGRRYQYLHKIHVENSNSLTIFSEVKILDPLEKDVMPPINEVNSGPRGLLILRGCAWYDTDTRYELW